MKVITYCIKFVIFILCLFLVVNGQKNIGVAGLSAMFIGLIGLLSLLFMYNRKHQ